jgi:hypothetical protein
MSIRPKAALPTAGLVPLLLASAGFTYSETAKVSDKPERIRVDLCSSAVGQSSHPVENCHSVVGFRVDAQSSAPKLGGPRATF